MVAVLLSMWCSSDCMVSAMMDEHNSEHLHSLDNDILCMLMNVCSVASAEHYWEMIGRRLSLSLGFRASVTQ